MFTAPELQDCLPGLKYNDYLKTKSHNEFLIRGKVEEQAIVGCVSIGDLRNPLLNEIAPGLSSLKRWNQKENWQSKMTKLYATHRNVSDKLLDSAVELAFAFKMNDKLHIVKELLSTNFHICSSSIEDDRILDRIWKRTVDDLRQAIEEFTQAIEQCTSVMNGLRD